MREGALEGASQAKMLSFLKEVREMQNAISAAALVLKNSKKKVEAMQTAFDRSEAKPADIDRKLHELENELLDMEEQFYGNRSRSEIGEKSPPTVYRRMRFAASGTGSTYGPTPSQQESLEIAREQFGKIRSELEQISNQRIPELMQALEEAGAPWIEGQPIPE